jgi:hypothetical protein
MQPTVWAVPGWYQKVDMVLARVYHAFRYNYKMAIKQNGQGLEKQATV